MKKTALSIVILMVIYTGATSQEINPDERTYAKARIIKIEQQDIPGKPAMKLVKTLIHLRVLDGTFKGKTKIAVFGGESNLPREMNYKVGDTVFVGISKSEQENTTGFVSIYDFDNSTSIIILIVLLLAAIITIGRIKGLASLAALIMTILLLFLVLIPLTLKGYPPLPIAVAISIVSILMTLPIIAGLKKKTLSAIIGACGGIIIATLLAVIFGWAMHLSGIVTNEMLTIYYAADVNIDLRGLVLSGMIIAALGAVMDICISIASSTAEIFRANPEISEKDAFRSVLTIGTDILGSMVNTLVLAYVGSSMALILWISMKIQPGMSFWMVLNYNPVLNEIVKAVIGSLGMFVSIPLTAFVAVKIHGSGKKAVQ